MHWYILVKATEVQPTVGHAATPSTLGAKKAKGLWRNVQSTYTLNISQALLDQTRVLIVLSLLRVLSCSILRVQLIYSIAKHSIQSKLAKPSSQSKVMHIWFFFFLFSIPHLEWTLNVLLKQMKQTMKSKFSSSSLTGILDQFWLSSLPTVLSCTSIPQWTPKKQAATTPKKKINSKQKAYNFYYFTVR